MRAYVRARKDEPAAQFLQVSVAGVLHRFALLHATIAQVNERASSRAARASGHSHNIYHVIHFTGGEADFLYCGKPLPARAGMLVLASPGEMHSFSPVRPGRLDYSEITFALVPAGRHVEPDPNEADEYLAVGFRRLLSAYAGVELREAEIPMQMLPEQSSWIESAIGRVLDAVEEPGRLWELSTQQAVADVLRFLVREVYAAPSDVLEAAGRSADLERARRLIEARYAEPLTVAELAAAAYMSPGHFQRAFKREVGSTPMRHREAIRIDAAKTLLRFSAQPCKAIALRLGYGDIYHFSKAFKRATGVSPTRYRSGEGRRG